MSETIKTKTCFSCKRIKPVSEFYKNRSTKDGFQAACVECQKTQDKSESRIKARRVYRKRYKQTDKGKETEKRYLKSDAKKNCLTRYKKSQKGKIADAKYKRSVCGRVTARRSAKKQAKCWPEKIKARNAVYYAIKTGKIPRPDSLKCSCGEQAQEYHHPSYEPEHWLDVVAKCIKCHRKIHRQ